MMRADGSNRLAARINAAAVGVRFSRERIRCWVWGAGTRAAGLAGTRARSEVSGSATHGFDDPSAKRQHVKANAAATEDAVEPAVRFFRERLGGRTN